MKFVNRLSEEENVDDLSFISYSTETYTKEDIKEEVDDEQGVDNSNYDTDNLVESSGDIPSSVSYSTETFILKEEHGFGDFNLDTDNIFNSIGDNPSIKEENEADKEQGLDDSNLDTGTILVQVKIKWCKKQKMEEKNIYRVSLKRGFDVV